MTTMLNSLAAGLIGAAALISGVHAGTITPDSSDQRTGQLVSHHDLDRRIAEPHLLL